MTKSEALKAAIDGKTVRCTYWHKQCYLKFFNDNFIVFGPTEPNGIELRRNGLGYSLNDWEIVPKYVDFAEAWKAYEEGKTIQNDGYTFNKNQSIYAKTFHADLIRGKWIILEDE